MKPEMMAMFGITPEQFANLNHEYEFPKEVPGRVAHIDADFTAYQVSADKKDEPPKSLDTILESAADAVEYIRKMAGAEEAVLHTTDDPTKGGRMRIAIQKEYQANRHGGEKPRFLDETREYLGKGLCGKLARVTGIRHTTQEADDGMAQAIYADFNNGIMCSMDKDLQMVPGWKLNMTTWEVEQIKSRFGELWIEERTSPTSGKVTKHVRGNGTKWFWFQVFSGDTADNIQGLPECPGEMWQMRDGTKAYKDLYSQYIAATDEKLSAKLCARLQTMEQKTKRCGQMLAYRLLEDVENDAQAFILAKKAFQDLHTKHGYEFVHWKTNEPKTPTQVLLSEMKLLWMRRKPDENDVLHWIKEVMK